MKGLKRKLAIILILVFTLIMGISDYALGLLFNSNYNNYVESDLKRLYKASIEGISEYKLIIQSINADGTISYSINGPAIVFMSEKLDCTSVLYDLEGNIISQKTSENGSLDLKENYKEITSINEVKSGKSIVDISNFKDKSLGKVTYLISYEDKGQAILTLIKDYTNEFIAYQELRRKLEMILIGIFILLFTIMNIFISKIVDPIIKITKSLPKVVEPKVNPILINRNDEIGNLAQAFNDMVTRLKEKDKYQQEFFNNITHELKTPISNIYGFTQILLEDDFNDEEFRNQAIKKISNESKRMNSMVSDLLDISKHNSDLKQLNFQGLNIKIMIYESYYNFEDSLNNRNIDVVFEVDEINFQGNKYYINILINNLFSNACKYANENSNLYIFTVDKRDFLEVHFKSQGLEIPQSKKEEIFEPFVRLSKKGYKDKSSSGLGLYICKSITKAHGGDIKLYSKGNVSDFYFVVKK